MRAAARDDGGLRRRRRADRAGGSNTTVLWFLLPPAVLFTGLAPAAVSFAAGQAAFTLSILILFNIIQPSGWPVGLVRIEDVAIGCAVSVVVGLLFWPRGAGSALGQALAEAVSTAPATSRRVRLRGGALRRPRALGPAGRAATGGSGGATARRRVPRVPGRTRRQARAAHRCHGLVTGVVVLRLTADAVLDLWQHDGEAGGDRPRPAGSCSARPNT